MKKLFFIPMSFVFFFIACKKEEKSPEPATVNQSPTPSAVADFTITPANINYTVGTTWVYQITTVDEHYYSSNPSANQSNTTVATTTVTVVRDTIISPSITGKILHYAALGVDDVNSYIREVMYYDPTDLKWHDLVHDNYNGGTEIVACLGINLPLTSTSTWQNTHASHPSSGIDSCFARGFDNVSCAIGNIKCIKFNDKYVSNTYWYNNIYGRVKTETVSYQIINPSESTGKFITTILTSFHN